MNLNKFKVSAPGHLSLFGEHAVQFGKTGISAALNLRTTLLFIELEEVDSEGLISLEFPQINLFMNISIQQFLEFYNYCKWNMRVLLCDRVHTLVASHSHMYNTENQKAIMRAFFYVLASVTLEEKINLKSICIKLSTKLMMNSNFMSLTPATVCFAACFLHWSYLQKGINDHNPFHDDDLKKICSYAAKCEETFYNSKSISPSVCTYGSAIKYRILYGNTSIVEFINISRHVILLVDSKQTPNIEIQRQRLEELWNIHQYAASSIFNKIESASNMAFNAFRALNMPDYGGDDIEKRLYVLLQNNVLSTAIDISQRLFRLLNVSHYHLDEICAIAQKHGLYGKYTDIHAGRYAYIWCQPDVSERRISFLAQELKINRFDVMKTSLTSSGVKIKNYIFNTNNFTQCRNDPESSDTSRDSQLETSSKGPG